jgi:predicted nucleotidyltransferase
MTAIADTFVRINTDLRRMKVEWALVGGLAVSTRSTPRFTADIDIAVSVQTDEDAETLVRDLASQGYRLFATVDQDAAGRLATARLHPPIRTRHPGVVLDLLFASSGIEPEIVRHATVIEIMENIHVPTAARGHLLALKILSRDDQSRPQDKLDIAALLDASAPQDLQLAREAIDLITQRGFNRNRDLIQLFDEELRARQG